MPHTAAKVPYKKSIVDPIKDTDALDDVSQVLTILEQIIIQIYGGQRKVSIQLTRQFSQRLKEWADQRMFRLNGLAKGAGASQDSWITIGACNALATYYYAVMLLSRPFLMYEAYRGLNRSTIDRVSNAASLGRRTLADSCVDSACCLTELIYGLLQEAKLPQKMPLLTYVILWISTS